MSGAAPALGHPRLHLRLTDSTNRRARELAARGAPHGTLVTADEQSAGRGRQGRVWVAPPRRALLMSLLLHHPPRLLPLAAGLAVAHTVGPRAQLKWPNDVLLESLKVAGILVQGRPQEGWAVLGVGLNVAVRSADLPPELQGRAGSLGCEPADREPILERLLGALEHWLYRPQAEVLQAVRARDCVRGQMVSWAGGQGQAVGIDHQGRLLVQTRDCGQVALEAGEVHLRR